MSLKKNNQLFHYHPSHPLCSLLGKLKGPQGHWSPNSLAHVVPQQFVSSGFPRPLLPIQPSDKLSGQAWDLGNHLSFQDHGSSLTSVYLSEGVHAVTLLSSVRGDKTLLWPGRVLGFNPKKTKSEIPNPPQNSHLPVPAQVGLFWNVGKDVYILSSCCQYRCVVWSSQLCQGFQFSPINGAIL